MRLVRFPHPRDSVRLINADLVTEVSIYPHPENHAYWEVSVNFGEYYIEWTFRNIGDARQLVADIAGKPVSDMQGLLT